ncbi:hypothetical protein [Pseudomonas sp. IT-P12]|uniref:hypothetical protein n=1 Tax=Pseudomonas sp. IT-P12 TaxID=3026450 RepID=UPI0039E1363F
MFRWDDLARENQVGIEMFNVKLFFTILVGLFSLSSCFLWIKSATVEVFQDEDARGMAGIYLTKSSSKGTVDVLKTAGEQTRWNKAAAASAAAAAICQVALTWITY